MKPNKKLILILLFLMSGMIISAQTKNDVIEIDSCGFILPNNLSPNGQDKISLTLKCDIKKLSCTIYDRWGKSVFSCDNPNDLVKLNIYEKIKKDGKENPRYPNGTYFWLIKYDLLIDEQIAPRTAKGSISIFSEF